MWKLGKYASHGECQYSTHTPEEKKGSTHFFRLSTLSSYFEYSTESKPTWRIHLKYDREGIVDVWKKNSSAFRRNFLFFIYRTRKKQDISCQNFSRTSISITIITTVKNILEFLIITFRNTKVLTSTFIKTQNWLFLQTHRNVQKIWQPIK